MSSAIDRISARSEKWYLASLQSDSIIQRAGKICKFSIATNVLADTYILCAQQLLNPLQVVMSAAQSDLAVEQAHEKDRLGIETPRHKAAPGSALEELLAEFQHTKEPIIAVDMDDVLSQTNQVVALCKPKIIIHYTKDPFRIVQGTTRPTGQT